METTTKEKNRSRTKQNGKKTITIHFRRDFYLVAQHHDEENSEKIQTTNDRKSLTWIAFETDVGWNG